MPPIIRGVLILILVILLIAFLWGCAEGIAQVIVYGS